ATDKGIVDTQDLSHRIATSLRTNEDALKDAQQASQSQTEALAKLKADVQSARSFVGQGDRQYLTGLKVGGDRVLVLLDSSASMLDETIVNVIRRRNMPDDQKQQSRKWRRATKTVEWLMSQLPLDGKFQIYTFNTSAQPLIEGSTAT